MRNIEKTLLLLILTVVPVTVRAASDDFNGSDGTQLLSHTSQMTWTANSAHPENCTIQSNALFCTAWLVNSFYSTSSVDTSQIDVSATFIASGSAVSPTVRTSSGVPGYYFIFNSPSGGNWTQVTIKKNAAVYIGPITGVSISQSVGHTLKITASGSSPVTIEVFIDGSSVGTISDSSSPIISGYSGFAALGDAIGGGLDNWTDGASSPTPLTAPTLSAPSDSATNQATSVSLSWSDTNSSPNETNYSCKIKATGGSYGTYHDFAADSTSGAASTVLGSGLANSTSYTWTCKAKGDGSTTSDSADATERSFTTVAGSVARKRSQIVIGGGVY